MQPYDLEARVERNPFGTIAAALGVGYVLGGGFFTPLTARALGLGVRLGLRFVVLPIVADHLVELARSSVTEPVPLPAAPVELIA